MYAKYSCGKHISITNAWELACETQCSNFEQNRESEMLGHNLAVDLFDCDPTVLDDLSKVESAIAFVVGYLNAQVIQILTHRFSPQGISCVALISASHVAIHTWPEHRFISVDIFSCGSKINISSIVDTLQNVFGASRAICSEVKRGIELSSPFFKEE